MSTFPKIVIIIVVVVALGAALYLYHVGSSGGFKLPSFSGSSSSFSFLPSLHPDMTGPGNPANSGGGAYIGMPTGSGSASTPPSLTVDTSAIPTSSIPAGFTAAQLSPYFHEVRFNGISFGNLYSYGTITLQSNFANYQATGTIDITGWQIKARGGGEYVPQAVDVYDPSGLAAPGDIRLANGDVAYFYSSSAPFNLRLNECIGYVAHVANFQPALPANCAQPDESRTVNFTGACQEYLQTLGGCSQPQFPNQYVSQTDYACQDFLENNFTYKSCFEQHASDPNFLSNQVWVWMGSNVVNQYHDTVDLFDRSGLLVDQYVY